MSITKDLGSVADMCTVGAKQTLSMMLALGPKPQGDTQALLWEQQTTRLQGQLNSLTALNSKLTAESVIEGRFESALADLVAPFAVQRHVAQHVADGKLIRIDA